MKHLHKFTTIALSAALIFSFTSCSKISEIISDNPFNSETTTSETSETSEATTTSTSGSESSDIPTTSSKDTETSATEESSYDSSASSESSPASSPDASSSSENECSFSPDGFLKAAKDADVKVYNEVDSFLDNYKALVAKDKDAIKNYKKGAVIKVSGSDIDKISSTIGNQAAQDGDFMSHAEDLTMLMAGDISSGAYTVVALSLKMDDPKIANEWFEKSSKSYENNLPDQLKDSSLFSLKTENDKDGDISYFISTFTLNSDSSQKLFSNAGSYNAAYVQGSYYMYITTLDYDSKEAGTKLMTTLCKSMNIKNPADI